MRPIDADTLIKKIDHYTAQLTQKLKNTDNKAFYYKILAARIIREYVKNAGTIEMGVK